MVQTVNPGRAVPRPSPSAHWAGDLHAGVSNGDHPGGEYPPIDTVTEVCSARTMLELVNSLIYWPFFGNGEHPPMFAHVLVLMGVLFLLATD